MAQQNLTTAESLVLMAEAARDFRTYDYIRQCIIDLWEKEQEMGLTTEAWNNHPSTNFEAASRCIHVRSFMWDQPAYETILECQPLSIGYGNKVVHEWVRKHKLPNGIVVRITRNYLANIPEEDMATLELLGKVNCEIIEAKPSHVEKTVFCPN